MALDRLTKIDGGGISTTSDYRVGIITATKFVGPIEGDVTGSITATDGTFSGNVTIGGTLSYEDVTNIDSVGIITARNGIDCNGDLDVDGHTNLDNVSVAGVSTLGSGASGQVRLDYQGNQRLKTHTWGVEVSGALSANNIVATAANSSFAGASFTGAIDANGDLDVDGHTNLDNVSVAGISTFSGDINIDDGAADSAAGPELKLNRGSASPANADYLGQIKFAGRSSTGAERNYAKITGKILDVTNGSEDGILEFAHIKGGSQTITGRWRSDSLQLLNDTNLSVAGDTTLTGDLDVDGHTNLDNVSIAGITTITKGLVMTASASNLYLINGALSYYAANNAVYLNGAGDSGLLRLNATGTYNDRTSINIHGKDVSNYQDAITFKTASNERLRITGGGSVNIGGDYTQTSSKLKVTGTVTVDGGFALSAGTFTAPGGFSINSGNVIISGDIAHDADSDTTFGFGGGADTFRVQTAGNERLRINSNGYIGLGSDDWGSYDINARNVLIASSGNTGITIRSGGATPFAMIHFADGISNANEYRAGRIIYQHELDSMTFNTANVERVRIKDGDVGINNTNPAYPLDIQHVGGNQNQTPIIRLFQSTDGCHNALTLESSTSSDKNIGIQFKNRSAVRGGIGYIQNDKINIYSGNSPAASHGMTINASGFCGINQLSPDRILHVMGDGETWPAGFESSGSTAKISFKSSGTTNMYEVGVGAEGRSLILLTANAIRADINTDGVMRARSLSGSYYPIASVRDGSTSARAATSAWEIKKTLGPAAKTGYYYLKNPYDGTTSQWWCDMTTDGGGWILIAHTGEGQMAAQSTSGDHWWDRNNKGGFDSVGSGYYQGGGYWRQSNGNWGENTCGQLMWDVRVHNQFGFAQYGYHDTADSNSKVVFNWGTDQALPSGNSGYSNIPNSGNRRFNDWCYEVLNAPGFNPSNYHQNIRSNVINGNSHFTEHMVMTFGFRGTGGAGDAGNNADGPYWMIGSHHDGLHQHYEETLSGGDGVYGDGGYQVVSNQDSYWANNPSGTNNGMRRLAKFDDSGTVNIWLR